MKRQRGRNRGGGGRQPQNTNRAFDSNGPEGVKVRGNPQNVFEKYQQLARDANASGDRVLGENYLQHAEHYFRLLRTLQPQRPAAEILGRDQLTSGFDIDFEDESGQAKQVAADEAAENSENQSPQAQQGQDEADNRDRSGTPIQGQGVRQNRDGGDGRQGQGGRRDRWRDRRERDDSPRGEDADQRRVEQPDQPARETKATETPHEHQSPTEDRGPILRDAEGGASQAPAFLQARPEPASEEPKPRTRRRRTRNPEEETAKADEG